MNRVFLLLGANLGNPVKQLAKAAGEIVLRVGKIEIHSAIYRSEAWGVTDQPMFLNQVLMVSTKLDAIDVLDSIQKIEHDLGRVRLTKWGARVIDIDILYFNEENINHERLIVPHPYLPDRKFALVPLQEIAPNFVHPGLGRTNTDLLESCEDPLAVSLYINENDETL
ncbi:2-amino-4-hydroxy-6-hydroxymethyldihydropteridine diphosphokinase [Sphingobacterium suaedae]|uniref:2-amino-4-hydroxy-6-hydroxymethyldihydropteridine pyrophosphokinase n=1 Tax=Sphingobacterium suaedae TaxID=1686402 RepID=A0ABW5KGD8_9SPHI